jgi:hypothetical protein
MKFLFLLIAALLPLWFLSGCGPKKGDRVWWGKKVGEDVTPEDGWIVSETENTITFRYWRMAYYGKRWGWIVEESRHLKSNVEWVEKAPDQEPMPDLGEKTWEYPN